MMIFAFVLQFLFFVGLDNGFYEAVTNYVLDRKSVV